MTPVPVLVSERSYDKYLAICQSIPRTRQKYIPGLSPTSVVLPYFDMADIGILWRPACRLS